MKKLKYFYPKKREELLLLIVIASYFIIYASLSILRHCAFHSYILDLGNYEQILWNTSHGRLFALSTRPWTDSYLGDHFSPILIFPSLIYKLFPYTATILILQTALIAFSGYLVYILAKCWSFTKKQSLLFTIIFFTLPTLGFINMFDAHANVFAIPLGLLFLIAFKKGQSSQVLIYLVLLLLVKEDLSLILGAFGLIIAFEKRHRYLGIFIFFLSAAWFYLVMTIFIPHFTSTGSYHYIDQLESAGSGSNIFSIITHPVTVVKNTFSLKKISYIIALFGSTLFIPLFSGRFALPVIIGLIPVLLSRWTSFSTILYHYPASYLAFLMFALMAAIFSLEKKKFWKFNQDNIIVSIIIIQFIIIAIAISGNFLSQKYCKSYFCAAKYLEPNSNTIKAGLELIPANASVSASNNLGSHLSQREKLYIFPRIENAQYILVDKQSIGLWYPYDLENGTYLTIDNSQNYQKIYSRNGILLYKHNN